MPYVKHKSNISCSGKLNNTRYDDLEKLMKQTCFKVKNLGGRSWEEQFTIK